MTTITTVDDLRTWVHDRVQIDATKQDVDAIVSAIRSMDHPPYRRDWSSFLKWLPFSLVELIEAPTEMPDVIDCVEDVETATEEEWWRAIAATIKEAIDRGPVCIDHWYGIQWDVASATVAGICDSITWLPIKGEIKDRTRERFSAYYARHEELNHGGRERIGFWWPNDAAGCRERIKVCLELAEEASNGC